MSILRIVFLLCFVAVSACGGGFLSVHDGDTFHRDGRAYRLWGVDAPELDQPWGVAAREVLRQLLTRGAIETTRKGRSWSREVVLCEAGGVDVSLELLKMGLAWYLPEFAPRRRDYREAEAEARRCRRGLWSDKNPVAPSEWRRRGKRIRFRTIDVSAIAGDGHGI